MLRAIFCVFAISAGVVACGDQGERSAGESQETPLPATASPSPEAEANGDGALGGGLPYWMAESLDTLVSRFPVAVVATVEEHVAEAQRPDIVPGIPDSPVSYYRLRIDDAILPGNLEAGDTILLGQAGGTRRDGIAVLTDTLPMPGTKYLFFLNVLPDENRTDVSTDAQYFNFHLARFPIDDHGRIVPTGHEMAPGIAAISGVTPDQITKANLEPDKNAALAALATRTIDDIRSIVIEAASRTTPRPTVAAADTPSTAP